jgi:DNA-binding beta-propeller fold protein YncE
MTNRSPVRSGPALSSLRLPALLFLLGIAVIVASSGACKKKETAAGGGSTETPAATEAVATPAPPSPATSPKFSDKPDTSKGPFGGLAHARALALDANGRIWVADFGNAAVRLFDANGGLLGGWGGPGDGTYAMKDPCGIAIKGDDVYVADTWRTGVERFSAKGDFKGKANAGLYAPHGVAVAGDGRVFIADSGNNRLVVCDADLGNPQSIGKSGAGAEEFSAPTGVAIGPSGNVYVTDAGNKRIQVLDGSGKFKARFKFNGWGNNAEPYLDADADDSLFVTDPIGQALVHVDRSGRELKRWTQDDEGRKFVRPTGVAVDRKGRVVYVMSTDGSFVSKIKLEK